MENEAPEVDSFAADTFNDVSAETQTTESGLDSWDEAESYEPPSAEETNEENQEEVSNNDTETSDSSEKSDSESSDADSEQDSEDGDESGSEDFELPEQLAEKGLVLNEGEVGKIIKIDGEDTFVSLDELGNDYSGQAAISRRFTEFSQEKQLHESEVAEVESYINEFGNRMKEGDAVGAFQFFGEFAGIPPYQVERILMDQLAPKIAEMQGMTAQELQAKYAQEENEYLKQSIESEREYTAAQQAQAELQAEIQSVREAHGIEDSEWDQAIAYLQEHEAEIRAQNPDIVMDANFVAEAIMDYRAYERAEQAFESVVSVDLSEDQKTELLEHVHDVAARNPDFDQNDLADLVKAAQQAVLETKTSKSLGKRVEKHGAPKPKPEENTVSKSPQEDEFLEDLWG